MTAPAGWYPDPTNPNTQRYWNGQEWAESAPVVPLQPLPPYNVMSILSLVSLLFFAPLGIIFGIIGLSQIKKSGERGRGLALGGIWGGSVLTALTALWVALSILFFGLFAGGMALIGLTMQEDADRSARSGMEMLSVELDQYRERTGRYPLEEWNPDAMSDVRLRPGAKWKVCYNEEITQYSIWAEIYGNVYRSSDSAPVKAVETDLERLPTCFGETPVEGPSWESASSAPPIDAFKPSENSV